MLADICDNDGKKILAKAPIGKEKFCPVTLWPNQEKTSGYSWQIWRRYLRRHFAKSIPRNTRLDSDWTMDKDLGLWTTNIPSISWEAYLVKAASQLYAWQTNGCYVCHKFVSGTMPTYEPTEHQSIAPPPEAEFTPITRRNGHIICSGLIEMFLSNMESGRPPPATF
eukprot:11933199-Ditylum_brightwellii.AAC.1